MWAMGVGICHPHTDERGGRDAALVVRTEIRSTEVLFGYDQVALHRELVLLRSTHCHVHREGLLGDTHEIEPPRTMAVGHQ